MRYILLVLFSVAIVAVLEAVFYARQYVRERRVEQLQRRLRALSDAPGAQSALLRAGKLAQNPALDEFLRLFRLARALEKLLEQADLRMTVAQLLSYSLALPAALVTVTVAFRLGPALVVLAALFGAFVPLLIVFMVRDQRSTKISEQLPDALDMMSRSLRSGHALTSAFELVAGEMPEPVNVEFGRAYESQRLGLALERAIVQMTERAPTNKDLKIFAVSVMVQKETGGNLAEILEKIAETIRARYRFQGKLRSLTAEGRASGWVLASLPVGMAGFLMVANPSSLQVLLDSSLGHLVLGYAAGSWLLGLLWMNRMTKIEL